MTLILEPADKAMLAGAEGAGVALAMRVVVRLAEAMDADRLLDISGAHIDSCLYHGQAGLDFAARLSSDGAKVGVPTTLNVSSLDLMHPELYRGDPETAREARKLMGHYEAMGCKPTWTCAPYQLDERPNFGDHIAWAESNAIVFANSVLGARTHRYGDFIDISAAITGRVPAAGLHLDGRRLGEIVFTLSGLSDSLLGSDGLGPVLGHHVGRLSGTQVPVIVGLPSDTAEHQLKSLGSAAAASGTVAMFHAVGLTPEAPTLEAALGGRPPFASHIITTADLLAARDELTTADSSDPLGALSLGTPHYSISEFDRLVSLLDGRATHPEIDVYVSTGRDVWHEVQLRGWAERIEEAGIQIVTDTCTYITPVMAEPNGAVMTDSAKWAYYAPSNLGVAVVLGTIEECVESAVAGHVVRDESVWSDA